MPAVIDNTFYDLLPPPVYGTSIDLDDPKIQFQVDGGYIDQRSSWTDFRKVFNLTWSQLTEGQKNILEAWLRSKRSSSFWFIDPTSLAPRPDGSIVPVNYCVRVHSQSVKEITRFFDGEQEVYSASLVLREV